MTLYKRCDIVLLLFIHFKNIYGSDQLSNCGIIRTLLGDETISLLQYPSKSDVSIFHSKPSISNSIFHFRYIESVITNAQNRIKPKTVATMMELFSKSSLLHSSLLKPQLGSSSGRPLPGHSILKLGLFNLYSYAYESPQKYYLIFNNETPLCFIGYAFRYLFTSDSPQQN